MPRLLTLVGERGVAVPTGGCTWRREAHPPRRAAAGVPAAADTRRRRCTFTPTECYNPLARR